MIGGLVFGFVGLREEKYATGPGENEEGSQNATEVDMRKENGSSTYLKSIP